MSGLPILPLPPPRHRWYAADVGRQGVILLGVLILEAGFWGLTGQILPNERTYVALRDEGDHLINLMRNLNATATAKEDGIEGSHQRCDEALAAMHSSVDRMAELAGQKR